MKKTLQISALFGALVFAITNQSFAQNFGQNNNSLSNNNPFNKNSSNFDIITNGDFAKILGVISDNAKDTYSWLFKEAAIAQQQMLDFYNKELPIIQNAWANRNK